MLLVLQFCLTSSSSCVLLSVSMWLDLEGSDSAHAPGPWWDPMEQCSNRTPKTWLLNAVVIGSSGDTSNGKLCRQRTTPDSLSFQRLVRAVAYLARSACATLPKHEMEGSCIDVCLGLRCESLSADIVETLSPCGGGCSCYALACLRVWLWDASMVLEQSKMIGHPANDLMRSRCFTAGQWEVTLVFVLAIKCHLAGRATGAHLAGRATGAHLAGRATGAHLAGRATGAHLAGRATGAHLAGRATRCTGIWHCEVPAEGLVHDAMWAMQRSVNVPSRRRQAITKHN
jgi:hypothetical protein